LNAIDVIKDQFSIISIEVQPLSQEEYERLHKAGVFGVSVSRNLSWMCIKKVYNKARNPT
jgi:2-iminoacetate synthase